MANNFTLIPEFIIKSVVDTIFKVVLEDLEENSADETKSLLYIFFSKDNFGRDVEFNTFKLYEQAKEMFANKKIEVNIGYNLEVADIPSVHILLPSENSRHPAIGLDENYQKPIEVELEDDEEGDIQYQAIFTKTLDSSYNVMLTSPNVFEIIIMYHLLKMGTLCLMEHIELLGLRNVRFGGQDVAMQSDLIPTHIFHRNFTLSFHYEMDAPNYFKEKLARTFSAEANITAIKC